MCQRLDLFVLSCVFFSVHSQTGQILPPENVSLLWISDFCPQLSWAPPQHSEENCTYEVTSGYNDYPQPTSPWSAFVVMGGGSWQFGVQTVCDDQRSELVVVHATYQELVTDLQCYFQSSKRSHCSWVPASNAPDLRFFFRLVNETFTKRANDSSPSSTLRECSSYSTSGGRTGCDLQANVDQSILLLFNGTLNSRLVRNTFKKCFKDDLRLPPLNWTVTKTADEFIINWVPPDVINLSEWTFTINYTECGKRKNTTIVGEKSAKLPLVSHCSYNMTIGAHTQGGKTSRSEEKLFDANTGPNALVYAVFIIPLMFACLAALTFVCCRKNKENIFPKVPEPRDLLSDISDNNNKSFIHNLYIPAEEEDDCKITLVIDPQINKLHS